MYVTSFRKEYAFLSNMYPCPVTVGGMQFKCAEAAFQSAKLPKGSDYSAFINADGPTARRIGRSVKLRPRWDTIRLKAMKMVVEAKFSQNEGLRAKLMQTFDDYLVEGNEWGDKFWGEVDGEGENRLGLMLMEYRNKLLSDKSKYFVVNQFPLVVEQQINKFIEQFDDSPLFPRCTYNMLGRFYTIEHVVGNIKQTCCITKDGKRTAIFTETV